MLEQAAGKINKAKPKRTHSKTLLSDKAKLKLDQLKEANNREEVMTILGDPDVKEAIENAPWSSALSLLKYAGTWEGDDIEECLEMVYNTRGKVEF